MKTDAVAKGRYADDRRIPGTRGSDTQRHLAQIKARLIARYGLASTPSRPEELASGSDRSLSAVRVVSIQYGCGTIRIRKHGGPNSRTWVETLDLPTHTTSLGRVYEWLDPFFGYAPVPTPSPVHTSSRPIRDNPQA